VLAAIHVHHPAHAAVAFTETERDSAERAAKKHEQKEQGCESRLHLYAGTLMKITNKSQCFKSSGKQYPAFFRQSLCPYDIARTFALHCSFCVNLRLAAHNSSATTFIFVPTKVMQRHPETHMKAA